MEKLIKEINYSREKLFILTTRYGIESHVVVRESQKLDNLITQYQKKKGDKMNMDLLQLYTYNRTFKVPYVWLSKAIKRYEYKNIDEFIDNYTWDVSQEIFLEAKNDMVLTEVIFL